MKTPRPPSAPAVPAALALALVLAPSAAAAPSAASLAGAVEGVALPLALIAAAWLLAERFVALLAKLAVRVAGRRDPVGPVRTGREGMIGAEGIARTALAPAGEGPPGKVQVRGEWWSAVADRRVGADEPVRVVDVEGLTLRVAGRLEAAPRGGRLEAAPRGGWPPAGSRQGRRPPGPSTEEGS